MPAVTVRMGDDDMALLRQQALDEDRSMNDVAIMAIRDRAVRHGRTQSDREAIARLVQRHRDTLDRLAQ